MHEDEDRDEARGLKNDPPKVAMHAMRERKRDNGSQR